MDIHVVNGSSRLTEAETWQIAWALDYQARYHLGRSGWRSDVRCRYAPAGAPIVAGGVVMHLLDASDQAGALGYHDEDGNEIPEAKVFVQTILDSGGSVSEVASHEMLEWAVDPNVNLSALNGDASRLYALEVGDPVQGFAYDVGAPQGRSTGIQVADFALPSYFDPSSAADRPTSYRGSIRGPFTIGPQGYMSYIDTGNFAAGWQQALGGERTAPPTPDEDDRVARRGVVMAGADRDV